MKNERDSVNNFNPDETGYQEGGEDHSAPGSEASACPREQMISEAAYYRGERRGFTPEDALADWFQAEIDVEGTAP